MQYGCSGELRLSYWSYGDGLYPTEEEITAAVEHINLIVRKGVFNQVRGCESWMFGSKLSDIKACAQSLLRFCPDRKDCA